jgi:hypothetical protein
MTLRKIIEIPFSHQLVILLPKGFHNKKKVLVTIDDIPESNSKKMDEMLAASKDPLYLNDMQEVNSDFDHLAGETL